MRWSLLLVLLVGCREMPGEAYELPGQAEAVDFVWSQAYGRTDRPPVIRWVAGDGLNCAGRTGLRGFVDPTTDVCVGGATLDPYETSIAWHGDMGEARIAHEFRHAALMRVRFHGDAGDGEHRGPEWAAGGLVPLTEAGLRERMAELTAPPSR